MSEDVPDGDGLVRRFVRERGNVSLRGRMSDGVPNWLEDERPFAWEYSPLHAFLALGFVLSLAVFLGSVIGFVLGAGA